jgi:hypothetical protein
MIDEVSTERGTQERIMDKSTGLESLKRAIDSYFGMSSVFIMDKDTERLRYSSRTNRILFDIIIAYYEGCGWVVCGVDNAPHVKSLCGIARELNKPEVKACRKSP